jgi:hypothetical protein
MSDNKMQSLPKPKAEKEAADAKPNPHAGVSTTPAKVDGSRAAVSSGLPKHWWFGGIANARKRQQASKTRTGKTRTAKS